MNAMLEPNEKKQKIESSVFSENAAVGEAIQNVDLTQESNEK